MANPKVFFDVDADGENLGRIVMEVSVTLIVIFLSSFFYSFLCTGHYADGSEECSRDGI